ncbi:hypothetical protein ATE80_09500 [Streptomyces kanasensis]|uniref:DUF4352 domain-containing protein n=1 Tax=Streptomyces kanasensis TaxID=936756 RepID=A0A124ECY0_9ACTN|nr:hypothetical protein ATE80_09500 [Streptomyces kanasensis]
MDPPGEGLGVSNKAVWARIEVKVCNDEGGSINVTQFPWSLAYADGAQVEVTGLHGGNFPKPEFPTNDKPVKPGNCVRGGIMFPVEPDQRPERIVYHPDSIEEPIEWAVPPSGAAGDTRSKRSSQQARAYSSPSSGSGTTARAIQRSVPTD